MENLLLLFKDESSKQKVISHLKEMDLNSSFFDNYEDVDSYCRNNDVDFIICDDENIGKMIDKKDKSGLDNFFTKAMLLELTKREQAILEILIENINEIVSRDEINSKIYLSDKVATCRNVDAHIKNIRKKLDIDNIKSIYGQGYIWIDK
ncbi:thiamine biosynthesis protein ThiC [Bacilli bacterium PM5-3]|nr:thiamine biosynthesis protein ThiC [Bacilli bacterium PM5-3]